MHLTVIYPPLTRFDSANGNVPFSGGPGSLIKHRTLDTIPGLETDVRPVESNPLGRPFVPGTRLLLYGAEALRLLTGTPDIHKQRGYRLSITGVPAIATYAPIDCWEFKQSDADDEDKPADEKNASLTRRSNYLFWHVADFKKLFREPVTPLKSHVNHYPNIREATARLSNMPRDGRVSLVIDIETRRQDHILDCIGLGYLSADRIYVDVVRIYRWNNKLAYDYRDIVAFWKVLYSVFLDGRILVIGHNIQFDLSVLHYYYHLPIPKNIADTMIFMHAHWPLADKSLHHAISYYTDAAISHKDQLCVNTTAANEEQLVKYNGLDVIQTAEVYRRQQMIAAENPQLAEAAAAGNAATYLAMMMTFTGMNVDTAALDAERERIKVKIAALLRIARILSGVEDFNPNSGKQIAEYLYVKLGYPVIEQTESGAASTAEGTMYELQLKQFNPLITVILAYKSAVKETAFLNFRPFVKHTSAI